MLVLLLFSHSHVRPRCLAWRQLVLQQAAGFLCQAQTYVPSLSEAYHRLATPRRARTPVHLLSPDICPTGVQSFRAEPTDPGHVVCFHVQLFPLVDASRSADKYTYTTETPAETLVGYGTRDQVLHLGIPDRPPARLQLIDISCKR
jgi:hypothetical protein